MISNLLDRWHSDVAKLIKINFKNGKEPKAINNVTSSKLRKHTTSSTNHKEVSPVVAEKKSGASPKLLNNSSHLVNITSGSSKLSKTNVPVTSFSRRPADPRISPAHHSLPKLISPVCSVNSSSNAMKPQAAVKVPAPVTATTVFVQAPEPVPAVPVSVCAPVPVPVLAPVKTPKLAPVLACAPLPSPVLTPPTPTPESAPALAPVPAPAIAPASTPSSPIELTPTTITQSIYKPPEVPTQSPSLISNLPPTNKDDDALFIKPFDVTHTMSLRKRKKAPPAKEKIYSPDVHCGVWNEQTKKNCLRALTCRTHSLLLKRAVPMRSKLFDVLLADHRANNKAKKEKEEVTPLYIQVKLSTIWYHCFNF
jgi:hypothetical protein